MEVEVLEVEVDWVVEVEVLVEEVLVLVEVD